MAEINWKKHIVTFLVIFLVGGLLVMQSKGCPSGQGLAGAARPPDARVVEIRVDRWLIKAEVADTAQKREKGLQGREALEPGYGMLFVFPQEGRPSFWMKDTTIPLSLAFIDTEGKIVQIERGQPRDATLIAPEAPCKYVLEVRQGWFEDRGLGPGTVVQLPPEFEPRPESVPAADQQ